MVARHGLVDVDPPLDLRIGLNERERLPIGKGAPIDPPLLSQPGVVVFGHRLRDMLADARVVVGVQVRT